MSSRFARFKSALSTKVVAAALALSVAFTPKLANSYSTGDLNNPQSFSIHPLLVEPLQKAYHQVFPQSQVDFFTSEIQAGSIKEDSAPTYQRAFHHFLQWQTGEGFKGTFSPSDEWAQDCSKQAFALQGNHCWDKVKEDFFRQVGPSLGENFGFWYHLNADLTVPAHVWDDAHPPGEQVAGGLAHITGLYSDPYETWTDAHRNEIISQVYPDLNAIPDTKKYSSLSDLMRDLAKFTGSNFYSADALDGRQPTNCTWDSYHTYCYRDVTDTAGRLVQSDVRIVHSGFFTDYPDSSCFEDYWPILSAKTVEYGIAGIQLLFNQTTVCTPNCSGKECGKDGCGGSCGNCQPGLFCNSSGKCLEDCIADCSGKVCGNNGCGGSCGSCSSGYNCNDGKCTKDCGPDSCGGSCGSCPFGQTCSNGTCIDVCVSNCSVPQKQCSGNSVIGCANVAPGCQQWDFSNPKYCGSGYNCKNGECVKDACVPNCDGQECGPNGCGGNCGACQPWEYCFQLDYTCKCTNNCGPGTTDCSGTKLKTCEYDEHGCLNWVVENCPSTKETCIDGECVCSPQCSGKTCGNDGCGGSCGSCGSGYNCINGSCIKDCTPNCYGKTCGNDGCGGSCGSCTSPFYCDDGVCGCQSSCYMPGVYCGGSDGCGGTCGCDPGEYCSLGVCKPNCTPQCSGKECGDNGCNGSCGSCITGKDCVEGNCCSVDPSCGPSNVGTTRCIPLDQIQLCALGTDGCYGWEDYMNCSPGYVCIDDLCKKP